ncbi:MAG: hypothetical protein Q9201_004528 [Fulgogasparrea decipioides]
MKFDLPVGTANTVAQCVRSDRSFNHHDRHQPQTSDGDPSNIGYNITGWHWVVRRDRNGCIYPAALGCVGELAIARHSLAQGYLRDNPLIEGCFVETPHLAGHFLLSRVYLTGDMSRYNADGSIRVMGRQDRMVKVNGGPVDPGEAEHQLGQQDGPFASSDFHYMHDGQGVIRLAAFAEIPSEIALELAFRRASAQKHQFITAADFFRLGGDSFFAIKLATAARYHGFEISVQHVHRHPVPEDRASQATPSLKFTAGTSPNVSTVPPA